MKKKINLLFGFTIAELLISLLITAIVAAAMVPVIGLKKLKSPHNRYGHGIAECYYDNGQLMYYYADNNRRGSTQPIPVEGDYCTFTPPKADYFEIIAIGAGTDGADGIPEFPSANLNENEITGGAIHINSNFQRDINNARIKDAQGKYIDISVLLRNLLNDWHISDRKDELQVAYHIISPVGAGGSATCKQVRSDYNNCFNCSSSSDGGICSKVLKYNDALASDNIIYNYQNLTNYLRTNEYCYGYIHASGGDSSTGYKTSNPVVFELSGSATIQTEASVNNAGVSVNDEYVYLKAVEGGDNGSFYDSSFVPISPPAKYTPESDILMTNLSDINLTQVNRNYGQKKGRELDNTCSELSGSPTSGKIFYPIMKDGVLDITNEDSGVLVWKYSGITANPKSGYGGNPGNEKTVVYENLKKPIILRPAPYRERDGENSVNNELSYVREDPENPATTLVSASSGGEHGKYDTMTFTFINADMPIPRDPLRWAKPDNRQHFTYVDKINASPFSGGIKNCGNDCPGFAGIGTYFYMDQLPDANTLSVTNLYNNTKYMIPTEKIIQEYAIDLSNPLCDDKSTSPIALDPIYYQHANNSANPDDDEIGQKSFTPKYCREPKVNGSPGAIIIMW